VSIKYDVLPLLAPFLRKLTGSIPHHSQHHFIIALCICICICICICVCMCMCRLDISYNKIETLQDTCEALRDLPALRSLKIGSSLDDKIAERGALLGEYRCSAVLCCAVLCCAVCCETVRLRGCTGVH